ncbi:complement resistance protein TraT [Legionella gresilensis]|uniref:complement resistance protein TraT n=1 Tax=Legionella gresilensis TaxID=91823 RepID=UPI0010415159|nr:complement resistance protein TraT [Legionella gresilensis]
MNVSNRGIKKAVVVSTFLALTSCAATQTALEHRALNVSTKQSETIFLEPVNNAQKTVFLSLKNTSEENVMIDKPLKEALLSRGYKVVNNPLQAHYLLQANILKIGKMSKAASQSMLGGGYGSALAGAATGAAIGSFGNGNTLLGGGLAGGVIGLAADSLVKDVNYTMITDIQISERVGRGIKVNEQFQSELKNGNSTITSQTSSRDSQYQRYRTRVVSNADKVNLKFQDARPLLEQGLVKVISGIF